MVISSADTLSTYDETRRVFNGNLLKRHERVLRSGGDNLSAYDGTGRLEVGVLKRHERVLKSGSLHTMEAVWS